MARELWGRTLFLTTLVSSLFLLVGCASRPPLETLPQASLHAPAEVVEPYIPSAQEVNPSAAASLSLEELLVFADAHAPVIQTAQARVGLAQASIVEAELAFPANPEVGFGAGGRTVDGATGFDFEVSVEQQLEVAGERGLRVDVAEADRRTAEAVVNEVRWVVHVEAHRLVVDLLLAAERRAQAERFVVFSEFLRDVARRQVDAGESPLLLLVADAELAQTREVLLGVAFLDASLRTRLAAIVGWPTETLPPIRAGLPPIRRAPDTDTLLGLMAERHPSLRTRELAVVARQARFDLERREEWPEPTVGLAYAREAAPGDEPEAHMWMLNFSVPIPLWRSNQGGQARAEAALLLADRERAETVRRLRSEIVQTGVALDAAADRVELYATGVVPQLEENLALLQRAYELGEADVLQVSQTRQRLLDASVRYLDARIAYYETATALEGLVGTDLWSSNEVTP